jgi:perosamine synthetase
MQKLKKIKHYNFKHNPYGKFIGNEYKYILECLDSENKNKRNFVGLLEKKFSKKMKCRHSIAFNSGTSTLHACLAALDVGYEDEVIIPAQTVIMCTFAVLGQNAKPVYADIDPNTLNVDPVDIENKITKKTKAIIAVHMHGLPADMVQIMKISKKYNIPVIEDSAQCVLGKIGKKLVGSFGQLTSYSFETKKHLSGFEGGMVTTNNRKLAEKVRKFGGLGYKTLKANRAMTNLLPSVFQSPNFKRHDSLGLNYRMNEITAATVLGQLERVDELVNRRIKVANLFLNAAKNCKWLEPQYVKKDFKHTYWTIAFKFNADQAGISWKKFYKLFKNKIGDGFYGGLSVVPEEPILKDFKKIRNILPKYNKCNYCKSGSKKCIDTKKKFVCKNAYAVQPTIIQMKANYRNLKTVQLKTKIFKNLITNISAAQYN